MTTSKQVALVTGANKGIGFETARQLAQQGYLVWLGCRDEARGVAATKELAKDGDVRFVRLDVTSEESVRTAAARITEQSGVLDVLVNNAGILLAGDGHPGQVSFEVLDQTFDVNVRGALRVTQAFLPLVRKSKRGRIVNVSSTMGSLTVLQIPNGPLAELQVQYPNSVYAASKSALNALTVWLAIELRDTAIKVNAVCPGYNATDMNNHMGTQPPSEGAKVVVRAATLDEAGPSGAFLDANGALPW